MAEHLQDHPSKEQAAKLLNLATEIRTEYEKVRTMQRGACMHVYTSMQAQTHTRSNVVCFLLMFAVKDMYMCYS